MARQKAPVESGGFLARHKCTRRPRARQCAGIRARVLRCRATRRALPRMGQVALWRAGYHANRTKAEKQNRNRCYRIPICVARHKETRQYHSRMTMRRDSCSSGALPRNAKSFAHLRGKPPYGARRLRSRYYTVTPYPYLRGAP